MKSFNIPLRPSSIATLLGGGCLMLLGASAANAGCSQFDSSKPASGQGSSSTQGFSMLPASYTPVSAASEDSTLPTNTYAIVGLWKFTLTAKGNAKIKDGTEIDFGYQTWHADGTELLNSGGRPPMTGSFCMGAWERVSYHHYVLNHVTLSWDSTGTVFVGPGNIREEIVVDETRDHFAGSFTLVQYSTDGTTVLAEVKGIATGDRISAK